VNQFLRNTIACLLLVLLAVPVLAQDSQAIEFGTTVEGLLSTGETEVRYSFMGEQGQIVVITMEAIDEFDGYLRLLDASGSVIAEDDDSAGSLNPRIGPQRLPANGSFTIVATSFGGSAVGAFRLTLETSELRRIEYGQAFTGELTDEETEITFWFAAKAGDVVNISLVSEDFDAYLTLSASSPNMQLVSNDDSGGQRNARIGPFPLTETGDYVITATSFSRSEVGEFTLTLDRADITTLAFDNPQTVTITDLDAAFLAFDGQANQVIDLRVDSGDTVDTTLTLIGPDSYQVAYDDDSGGRVDPALYQVVLPADGTYYLTVQPYIGTGENSVSVLLSESMLQALDTGPQIITFDDKTTSRLLTFAGQAGEHVQLSLTMAAANALSPDITIRQGGVQIASVSTFTISDTMSFGFVVPEAGRVVIEIRSYEYTGVAMTVRLERTAQ
jgi:hypothetical protein